jgi:uncharacterized protein (DUF362 family)
MPMAMPDRRTFIKGGFALGGAALIGAGAPRGVRGAGAAASGAPPDLATVKGADPFSATRRALELLGGIGRFVRPGSTVGLLINHPFRHPGTHVNPDVALAVLAACFEAEAGMVLSLKDAPSGYWMRGARGKELAQTVRRLAPSSDRYETVPVRQGESLKEAEIIRELVQVDVLVNVSISKNHDGTHYSGILKNAMGAATYATCRFFHYGAGGWGWYGNVDHLSQCVADLNRLRRPDLSVCDATQFITSNGPFGPGDLQRRDTVVAGADPVAVDAFCAAFLGLTPGKVGMIAKSAAAGLGEMDLTKVRVRTLAI